MGPSGRGGAGRFRRDFCSRLVSFPGARFVTKSSFRTLVPALGVAEWWNLLTVVDLLLKALVVCFPNTSRLFFEANLGCASKCGVPNSFEFLLARNGGNFFLFGAKANFPPREARTVIIGARLIGTALRRRIRIECHETSRKVMLCHPKRGFGASAT